MRLTWKKLGELVAEMDEEQLSNQVQIETDNDVLILDRIEFAEENLYYVPSEGDELMSLEDLSDKGIALELATLHIKKGEPRLYAE